MESDLERGPDLIDYFRLADHTPSGEPISRGCECNGDFRQLASGSKDLCILVSVM